MAAPAPDAEAQTLLARDGQPSHHRDTLELEGVSEDGLRAGHAAASRCLQASGLQGYRAPPAAAAAAAACSPRRRPCALAAQASHFLSTWGQRGFEFAVGLVMLELHPSSLLLVAAWGLLDGAVSVLAGAAVGAWVDRQPRLAAATRMYLLQNAAVAASAAAALSLLLSGVRSGPAFWAGLAATVGAGSASTLGALGSTLSGAPLA